MKSKHIIILDVVGLADSHLRKDLTPNLSKLLETGTLLKINPVFPAVTCAIQTSMLSGFYPDEHGITGNGLYDRSTYKVSFWEQPGSLVLKPRIWDLLKKKKPGVKTAVLFWQNIMFANSDIIITPAPLHTEDGKMTEWCYSKPVGLYEEIANEIGEFNLMSYWGPFASYKSSEWITKSVCLILEKFKPNLLFAYLPHLDYSFQRFGPDSPEVLNDVRKADEFIGNIVEETRRLNMDKDTTFIIVSEYGFTKVDGVILINLLLRRNGLLKVKNIRGKEYIDFENSIAFAMVDHQIAHIYVKDNLIQEVYSFLKQVNGIQAVFGKEEKEHYRINHPRSGDLIAVSDTNRWFAYYWWKEVTLAPGFVHNVDIHRKPGYDPLELFLDPVTKSIPLNLSLIKGSHGCPVELGGKESVLLVNPSFEKSGILNINDTTDIFQILCKRLLL